MQICKLCDTAWRLVKRKRRNDAESTHSRMASLHHRGANHAFCTLIMCPSALHGSRTILHKVWRSKRLHMPEGNYEHAMKSQQFQRVQQEDKMGGKFLLYTFHNTQFNMPCLIPICPALVGHLVSFSSNIKYRDNALKITLHWNRQHYSSKSRLVHMYSPCRGHS